MSYERVGLLLEKPNEPAIDAEIATSLENMLEGKRATFQQLQPPKEFMQQAADELRAGLSPDLTAGGLDDAILSERLSDLRHWKLDLLSNPDMEADLKQAYRWRVNEEIAHIHMQRASRLGNMRSFKRWNEFVYGKPSEPIYRAALDWVASDADDLISEHGIDSPQGLAAQSVLDAIGRRRGDKTILAPSPEVFSVVQNNHRQEGGYYDLLLSGVEIPVRGKIDRAIGSPILRHVVEQNLQSDYDIRHVEGGTWRVNHADRVVEQPDSLMVPRRFIGLALGHEIGSHLLERVNGERGPIQLARTGLDRYELGSEGRAVIREQVVYDTFDSFEETVRWRDILRRHIAISYACGVADDQPRTAAETYKFMNAIDVMYQVKLHPESPDKALEKAESKTSSLLLRVLKGTDGSGGAYLKDKIYLEGNVAVWQAAQAVGPDLVSVGDLGKFDVTNTRHIVLLQNAGLLPANSNRETL